MVHSHTQHMLQDALVSQEHDTKNEHIKASVKAGHDKQKRIWDFENVPNRT